MQKEKESIKKCKLCPVKKRCKLQGYESCEEYMNELLSQERKYMLAMGNYD